jgi:hypothetical protein
MVAGGGGGGTDRSGGGGAGGLVFLQDENISGQQTVIVGAGGAKMTTVQGPGNDGSETVAFGYISKGGGGGGGINTDGSDAALPGNSGGSGGGGCGRTFNTVGGVSNQLTYNGNGFGNNGGTSSSNGTGAGGGGGAGTVGQNGSSHNGGNGGDGKDYSTTFGAIYGDSGWFAGGGGGGYDTRSTGNVGQGGLGGGGRAGNFGTNGPIIGNLFPIDGYSHTGGGGGGTGVDPTRASDYGAAGGSGIVLMNYEGTTSTPSLTYDGYNKLTVSGADDQTLYKDSNSWSLGTASNVYVADPGEYTYFTRDAATAFLANVVVGTVTTVTDGNMEVKIQASDKQNYDHFGYSVSIDGEYAIVGAIYEATGDFGAGAAYIFKRDGTSWTQQAKIQASDKQAFDQFGWSVAISGDYVIVGAFDEDTGDTGAGAAYIFKRDGTSWTEQAKIQANDTGSYDQFGYSVSISEDYAIVGSRREDTGYSDAGAAYIFKRDGTSWTQQAKIQASDKESNDRFGHSVAISGDYVIVGADGEDTGQSDAGAAYIFKRDGTSWTQQAKIQANDTGSYAQFGYSVAISGDYVIVSATGDDTGAPNAGAAYIFKRDGTSWTQQAKIQASVIGDNDAFGYSVSISGDYAIVGTPWVKSDGSSVGAAYVFKRDGTSWTEQLVIQASDKESNDRFGHSVAISEKYVIVGAYGKDIFTGCAYIYHPPTKLIYDGITNLKITGAEASSYITYKSATNDKLLACGTDLTTYPLYRAGGNYKAEVSGPTTFTFTSNVTVPEGELLPLYKYPPDGATTSNLTESTAADTNSVWTLSGAAYGNGEYNAQANVAVSADTITAYHAFDSNLTAGFSNTSVNTGTLRLQLPSAETIHKYVVWPKAEVGKRPKSWTIEGSQDAVTWTTIHTVTDSPPSLSGDAHEITSPAAYVYYRINVTANNGGTGLEIAELALYGDVAFSITFSDGWVTTNSSNVITIGSSYTLPTYTSSLPVTVTGAGDFDVNTVGTYRVVYTSIGIDELARRVVRRFVVEYPTVAFHYGGFVATDYGGIYSTKEDAAADGFFYADTATIANDPVYGSLTVVSNTTSNTEYTWTPYTAMTADVLMVAGGGGGGGVNAGGGGAGGLVFSSGETISSSQTIIIGNGGEGGKGYANGFDEVGEKGNDTSFLSYIASGGGGGGTQDANGGVQMNGGSGGGNNGNYNSGNGGLSTQNTYNGKGFGNPGGNGADAYNGGGGGGAGSPGSNATGTNGTAGKGGDGKDYSSTFGNKYGDNGWFAGGGGGASQTGNNRGIGSGGQGGGGDGKIETAAGDKAPGGLAHTGGGGGGAGYTTSNNAIVGGKGGSGIVLIKRT